MMKSRKKKKSKVFILNGENFLLSRKGKWTKLSDNEVSDRRKKRINEYITDIENRIERVENGIERAKRNK